MRKFMLLLIGCLIGLLVAAVIVVGGLYWASQQQPTFYREALVVSPEKQREASDQLLAQAAALNSTARREGDWEAAFTAEQINGWLAVDLVENHPEFLPKEIRSPRVAFKSQEVLVGWVLSQSGIDAVCSLRASVTMLEPNVLAVRLRDAYAGSIPLPLGTILDAVRDRAAEAKIQLEWRQADGDPVAIVRLPMEDESGRVRRLDLIELLDGKVFIKGGVESAAQAAARRDRPVKESKSSPAGKAASANVEAPPLGDDAPMTARIPSVGAAAAAKVRRSRTTSSGRYL